MLKKALVRAADRVQSFPLWAALTAALLAYLLGPTPSNASEDGTAHQSGAAQAEALLREATALRRAGKDVHAYPLFQKAYDIETTPRTAAQLGLVEMQLGYWLLAEKHLTEALASPRHPWVASNRSALETSLAGVKAAIGEVMVSGTPLGAIITINGKEAGALPLPEPIRLGEGPANVEVRAQGYEPVSRSLSIVGGKREVIRVALEPQRAAGGLGEYPNVTAGPAEGSSLPDGGGFAAFARPLAWTATAGAVGMLGLGVYGTVKHQQKLDQYEKYLAPGEPPSVRASCGEQLENHGGPGCASIYSDMKQARKLAILGYVAGGLFAAGAVTLFLISPSDAPFDARIACRPSLAPAGGVCRLAFW